MAAAWRPSTEPVIVTCALTGGIHGKEANPNLPEQPDEIVEQGIEAWRSGAAALHVHARNPDGSNTMDTTIYGHPGLGAPGWRTHSTRLHTASLQRTTRMSSTDKR